MKKLKKIPESYNLKWWEWILVISFVILFVLVQRID